MLQSRDSNPYIWLSTFLLIFAVGCSENKKFDGRAQAGTDPTDALNPGSGGPHTSKEDDTPIQFPSMITASQFLMNCRANALTQAGDVNAMRFRCNVQSPYSPEIVKSTTWGIQSGFEHLKSEIHPSIPDKTAADFIVLLGPIFPLQITAGVQLIKQDMPPFDVTRKYTSLEEMLPDANEKAQCTKYKKSAKDFGYGSIFTASSASGFIQKWTRDCTINYINIYLKCLDGNDLGRPKECEHPFQFK